MSLDLCRWKIVFIAVFFAGMLAGRRNAAGSNTDVPVRTAIKQTPSKMSVLTNRTASKRPVSVSREIEWTPMVEEVPGPVIADFGGCGKGCADACCCLSPWAHRTGIFADYLNLRVHEGEVAYAVALNGGIANDQTLPGAVQVSPIALAEPDYSSNYQVGGTWALSQCASVSFAYTHFESNSDSSLSVDPADFGDVVIRSLVLHPAAGNANADFLNSSASLGIDFKTADVDYRSIVWASDLSAVNYIVGARFAELNQDFAARYTRTGTTDLMSADVEFDGGGVRFGLDATRHHPCNGFLVYGRGLTSFVAGEFKTSYRHGTDVDPEIVNTGWEAARIMTMVDMEFGGGWQSRCGRLRVTAGYLVSFWFNAVTTDQWIRAVRDNDFVGQRDGMSYDTLMFDGLRLRAEYRF